MRNASLTGQPSLGLTQVARSSFLAKPKDRMRYANTVLTTSTRRRSEHRHSHGQQNGEASAFSNPCKWCSFQRQSQIRSTPMPIAAMRHDAAIRNLGNLGMTWCWVGCLMRLKFDHSDRMFLKATHTALPLSLSPRSSVVKAKAACMQVSVLTFVPRLVCFVSQ